MKKSKIFIEWCISLMVVAVATIVFSIANIMGASIPDAVIRILGTVELIAGPTVLITSVMRYKEEKEKKEERK